MAGDRTLKLQLLADTKNLVDGLNKGKKESETFADKIDKINRKVGLAFAAMGAAATAMAVKFTKDAIGAASDLEETISKIGVIFGKSATEIKKFADSAARNLGQSKQQALDAAATFAIFGKSAGLSGEALVNFSTDFVQLASDLASFNNTTPQDAILAIGAALRGESEPLRRYGVLLNDAALKAAAMEMGIYNGTGALTAQQKVLAAQKVIMEQTTLAQGDFARTSDGLANSQRQIEAAVKDVQTELGNALLPLMLQLADFTEKTVVPALGAFIGGLTGKGGITDAFSKTQLSADKWGKRVRGVIDLMIEMKDVAVVLAQVLATIFVVSKISAAVQGTIALIQGLIKVYNALRVSALAAGIAAAFALNPALGIGAGVAAIATMGTFISLANKQSSQIGDGGQDLMQGLQYDERGYIIAPSAASTSAVSSYSGGSFVPDSVAKSLGTGGKSIKELSGGLVSSPEDLIKRLESTSNRISDIQFALDTGQISKAKAAELLKPIQKEFNMLQRVGESLQMASTPYNMATAEELRFRQGERASQIVINVNAPSIIDENGFMRAIQNAELNALGRGTLSGGL